jgi:hypothetical protein
MGENFGMDDSEGLEQPVAAVESEVKLVRQEAAAARALAAGADRDVADYRAEMRAHTRGLNALRQTQFEHYAEHKADMAEFKASIAADTAELKTGIAHIVQLLEGADGGSGHREG